MRYLLGVDIGTTGTKTLLFREDGKLIEGAYCPYATDTPAAGRSEQNPLDWWNAVVQTVRKVCQNHEIAKGLTAISLSTQGGTLVPVDSNFEPVRPAIVWNDVRCGRECQCFAEKHGADTIYRKTGWALAPGQNLMQIRWMKDHEPELFKKTAYFLSVPDYISYQLTGIAAVDPSNAGINQLADIVRGDYDPQLLDFAGITRDQVAEIVPSGSPIGKLTVRAAEQLGLHTDVVLVSGAHDQYAVALGAGACENNDILVGTGTCWVVTRIADAPDFSSGLAQSVAAVPGKWGSLKSLSAGGVCLEWWRKNLAADQSSNLVAFEQINAFVSQRKAAEEGLFFYPFSCYAGGGNTIPKAAFVGMDLSHDRYHLARAIMEGVAFQLDWMLEDFGADGCVQELKLTGGATKSELWCQMVADITGLPVQIPQIPDLACTGAAILAGVGCDIYESAKQGYTHMSVPERTAYPDPAKSEMYQKKTAVYRKCAQQLCGLNLK